MTVLGIAGSLRSGSLNREAAPPRPGRRARGHPGRDVGRPPGSSHPYDQDDEDSEPEAVASLREAISSADAVLIVTPEYNGSIPGVLKNAIDWAVAAGRPHGLLPQQAGCRDQRERRDVRRDVGRRRAEEGDGPRWAAASWTRSSRSRRPTSDSPSPTPSSTRPCATWWSGWWPRCSRPPPPASRPAAACSDYPGPTGPPSTSGPGHGPFKAVARVRIPLGA